MPNVRLIQGLLGFAEPRHGFVDSSLNLQPLFQYCSLCAVYPFKFYVFAHVFVYALSFLFVLMSHFIFASLPFLPPSNQLNLFIYVCI